MWRLLSLSFIPVKRFSIVEALIELQLNALISSNSAMNFCDPARGHQPVMFELSSTDICPDGSDPSVWLWLLDGCFHTNVKRCRKRRRQWRESESWFGPLMGKQNGLERSKLAEN